MPALRAKAIYINSFNSKKYASNFFCPKIFIRTRKELLELKQAEKISKDIKIGELVEKHPETAEVMLSYGLHCVGCHFNPFDTIESGCALHGIPGEKMTEMLDEINLAISEGGKKGSPSKKQFSEKETEQDENGLSQKLVEITPVAARKLLEIASGEGKKSNYLRIASSEKEGGCGCSSFYMEFEETPAQSDLVQPQGEMKVIVAKEIEGQVRGTVIDFAQTPQNEGFVMRNPNANRACGCGH